MTRHWPGRSVGASLLGLSLALSGCVSLYYVHPGALEPSRAQIHPEERTALWRRAVGVLLDQGYVPQVLNESTMFISAKRREDFDNDPLAKTMVTLFISPDGAVRVELTGVGLYTSEKEFLREVGERQRKILDLLVDRRGKAADAQ